MFDAKALRKAMIDEDCSMKELAAVCNISTSALNRRMRGKVCFTLGEIFNIEARLKLTPERRNQIFFAPDVS